jgi:type I restriction enzyme S subunit
MGVENNIPEGWMETTLGDLVERITKGTTPKIFSSEKNDVNYIKSDALNYSGFLDNGRFVKISNETNNKLKRSQLKVDDILLSMAGEKLGKTGIIKEQHLPANTNQAVAIITVNKKRVGSKFLWYKLRNKNTVKYFKTIPSQSAQPNINFQEIRSLPINLPTLPEQKAIAKVLTAFDDKIELLQAQNKTLETMAQTIFKEWFGKYQIGDELPEGWRIEVLGDVLETYLGGTPSKSKNEYWDNGSIPWINSGEVNNFRITAGTSLITRIGLEKSATKLLPKGTVVIAITGATLGQYSILEIDSCFNQSVIGIVGNSKIKSSFIYFWIANNIHAIIRNATGGAQQHINKEDVNSFEMIVPSDELLNRYQSTVEPMMDKITNNEFEIQSLTKTRDTLLSKLMSGQVRVNNIKQTADA